MDLRIEARWNRNAAKVGFFLGGTLTPKAYGKRPRYGIYPSKKRGADGVV